MGSFCPSTGTALIPCQVAGSGLGPMKPILLEAVLNSVFIPLLDDITNRFATQFHIPCAIRNAGILAGLDLDLERIKIMLKYLLS